MPDIRATGQALIVANANIGVAKAAFFYRWSDRLDRRLKLKLATLFFGPDGAWSFVPQITQPIFTVGRLKNNLRPAQAGRKDAQITYEKSIQAAFQQVLDALIAYQRTRESRVEQQKTPDRARGPQASRLTALRGGVDTQLNALDVDRDLLSAELIRKS